MESLHQMTPPEPFNPDYDPRWKEISKEAHRRTREVIKPVAFPSTEHSDRYQKLYNENFKTVQKELDKKFSV